jgi:hypothetical protein
VNGDRLKQVVVVDDLLKQTLVADDFLKDKLEDDDLLELEVMALHDDNSVAREVEYLKQIQGDKNIVAGLEVEEEASL